MSHAITTTISESQYLFLDTYAKKHKRPRNYVIEQGLKLLEQQSLEEAIREGFKEHSAEYKKINSEFAGVQSLSLQ